MTAELSPEAKDRVTLGEAAQRLSKITGKTLLEADILGLALNGHFQLSVFLPPTVADCWDIPEEADEGNPPDYWADKRENAVDVSAEVIRGVWDVPLVPPGDLEVRRVYHELRGLPSISAPTTVGSLVEKPGGFCRLRTAALTSSVTSAVSPENQFVIRTERLDAYIATLSAVHSPSSLLDKNISKKERQSLYIIIAALAKVADLPLFNPSKAAGIIIHALTKTPLSGGISSRNVEEKLKDVVKVLGLKD